MRQRRPVLTLTEVIDRMVEAGEGDRVSGDELLAVFGARTYGPLILMPSLLLVSPLSAIPGFSTLMGVTIVLIAGQMLLGRETPWLPALVLRRSVPRERLARAARVLRRVARAVDAVVRPRLSALTGGVCARAIALVCACIGLVIPPMEVVPMTSTTAGAVVAVFALALTAGDGVLALAAILLALGGIAAGVGLIA